MSKKEDKKIEKREGNGEEGKRERERENEGD